MIVSAMSPALPRTASVDGRRWPDVATLPKAPGLRAARAERLVRRALARLPLRIRLGTREPIGLGGPLMEVHDPQAFFRRIGADGLTGFGESYLAGEWDAHDLVGALTVFTGHAAAVVPEPHRRRPRSRQPEYAEDEISPRSDLPHELSALFLDDTLSYSSAVFRGFPAEQQLLAAAQQRKTDRLLDRAKVTGGTQLLEIGTNGGGLAIRAALRGARVLTVTSSREQQELAQRRVRRAGLEDRVTVLLRDYHTVLGRFHAIVSAETIEAVGPEAWPDCFMTLDRLLAPGGRVALQAVTMTDARVPASRDMYAWIQKYVRPGELLPSAEALEEITGDCTALRVAEQDGFGPHYAETVRLWRERFEQRSADVEALGFDETFRRMWRFYLGWFEAGFRAGCLDVRQLVLTKEQTGS